MVEWSFIEVDDVPSTQTVARDLAAKGAPEGTAVVARSQSSGKGRLGRTWISPPGGLYMSFILRPVSLRRPELAAMVAAAAVARGVSSLTGLETRIRWPNDIMLSGRKLGGVIAQAQTAGATVEQIVIGIGVNCNAPVRSESEAPDATSLGEELGTAVQIAEVRSAILESFSSLYRTWCQGEEMAPVWTSNLSTIGKEVQLKLKTDENPFAARATGVSDDGALVVDDGHRQMTVHPDELEWLRERS